MNRPCWLYDDGDRDHRRAGDMAAPVRLVADEARPLGPAGRGFFVGSCEAGN